MVAKKSYSIFRVLASFLFLFLGETVCSQSHHFVNYTEDDGLASNEVHCAFEDSDGTMLFGTDRGLQRFDGNTFEIIPFEKSSLSLSSVIFDIKVDSNEVIWINTYRNGLFYLDGDTIKEHPFNYKIVNHLKNDEQRYIAFDKDNRLYIYYRSVLIQSIFRVEENGDFTKIIMRDQGGYELFSQNKDKRDRDWPFYLFTLNDEPIFGKILSTTQDEEIYSRHEDLGYSKTLILDSLFHFFSVKAKFPKESASNHPKLLSTERGSWVSHKKHLIELTAQMKVLNVYDFESVLLDIKSYNDDIIVCTFNGVYILKKFGEIRKKELVIDIIGPSSCLVDKSKGMWITSITKGIFYCANPSIKQLDGLEFKGNVTHINTKDSLLVLSGTPSFLEVRSLINNRTLISFNLSPNGSSYISDNFIFSGNSCLDRRMNKLTIESNSIPNYNSLVEYSDSLILATKNRGIQFISKTGEWLVGNQSILDTSEPRFALCLINDILYVGDANGVYTRGVHNPVETRFLPHKIHGLVWDIKNYKDQIWISTRDNGVYLVLNDSVVYHSKKSDPKIPTVCGKIIIENDSVVWLCSLKGLFKLSFNGNQVTSTLFNTDFGLISDRINDLTLSNGTLYLGTNKGVYYTKTEDLKNSDTDIHLNLGFPNLNVNNYDESDSVKLPLGKRDIYLIAKEKSIRHKKSLSYSYVLNGDKEIISDANSISFAGLKPGLNTIHVNIANANLIWNSKPLKVKIWVPSFIYEKSWFKIGVIAFGILLLIASFFLFFRSRDISRKRKFNFALAQYNALSLQLSPHFIFNSLNNIQYLSVSKNYVSINQFVANLARLTRNILEHSKLQLIPLETEIENLRLYLEIEKIRFEHKPIDLQFDIDPNLNTENLKIPPMIIQPSVENAIWHGLLNKKTGSRKLSIDFKSIKNGFEVSIQDNGIGLHTKQNGKIKIKGKTSVGVKNTKERITLYNDMQLGKASFSLKELKNENEIFGTLVRFEFITSTSK